MRFNRKTLISYISINSSFLSFTKHLILWFFANFNASSTKPFADTKYSSVKLYSLSGLFLYSSYSQNIFFIMVNVAFLSFKFLHSTHACLSANILYPFNKKKQPSKNNAIKIKDI